ncbi:MAG: translation initiation factor IF-3 [bacterium]
MNKYPYRSSFDKKPSYQNNRKYTWRTPEEMKYPRNEWIKADEVRVVTDDGNLGVMNLEEAKKIALESELDLILIAPISKPPVCKITAWSKFLYNLKKREKQAQKNKQKEQKEFRFGTYIDEGDKMRLLKRAMSFLDKGHNVKITVSRKGRTPVADSKNLLNELLTVLSEYSTIDSSPSYSGRMISMTFKGEVKKVKKTNGKTKDKKDSSKKIQDDKSQGK